MTAVTDNSHHPAVVLLSGGLDSATALAVAHEKGFRTHALTFRYGQRHSIEVVAAERVASHVGVRDHLIVDIDLRKLGGSALTADIEVPKDRHPASGIPVTYVPARNTIFLSYALALAEVVGASDVFIGVNAVDYSGYPDCRPEYIAAYQSMANLATKAAVEGGQSLTIQAPLIKMTKAEIIKTGSALGLDFSLTISCYDPTLEGAACGHCDACVLRANGFLNAGLPDPTNYVENARTG